MRQVASMFAICFAICGVVGCKSKDAAPSEGSPTTQHALDPRMHTTWEEQSMQVEQKPVAVREGTTPLAHIFDHGGPVSVMDLTANIRIAAGVVGDRTLVRIDDRHGVIFGKDTITPGPLPAGHRYGIFADPSTENVFRQGIGPPARIDPPSKPSN
jgi:hypothetical protein